MKIMKTVIAILLSAALAISMCACGGRTTETITNTEQVTVTQTVTVDKTTTISVDSLANGFNGNQQPGNPGMPWSGQMPGGQNSQATSSSATPGEIVYGVTENSAVKLEADLANATTYDVSENSDVNITEAGTYIVTGTAADGNITVKKGTTGVVLILKDLNLTSTTGATVSINKNAEAQIIISGNVILTDNEDPADEESTDTEIADAYDGAVIKAKAGSAVYITGDGTLTLNGTAKNGLKAGDESSLIIGGEISININASNDAINANYDMTILSGTVTINAVDDAIHADHILTIGTEGSGPTITITACTEGLEGTVVNILGGKVSVIASDDGINAANKDALFEDELTYSVNILGGEVTVKTSADGIDSNGNINLIAGSATISSANMGGEAGIDYDGDLYISDSFVLNNASGVAGPDMFGPGQQGGFGGQIGPGGFRF